MKTEYLREFAVFSRYLSFTDAAKELFQARIADIDQKDALRGRGSVCQFDRPR